MSKCQFHTVMSSLQHSLGLPFKDLFIFDLHVHEPLCVYLHMGVQCSKRPGEGVEFSGTGVTEGCQLLCGGWELNSGPL